MMYEELVRCLRGHSQKMGCTDNCICEDSDKRGFGTCSEELAKLAADAIEGLQKALDAVNDAHNEGYDVGYWAGRRDYEPKWIPVTERLPKEFVSVQAHMIDAGQFPSVREGYLAGGKWYFPALNEYHPVDKWAEFSEPMKEDNHGTR